MEKSKFAIAATAALALVVALAANGQSSKAKFGAALKGSSETPPVDAKGTGTATFTVSGTSVDYKITASGLSGDATAAHIHLGPTTAAGPVVVPFPAKAFNNSGKGSVTISGSFTSADIKPQTDPSIKNLDDLLAQMRAGNTYVNIHTAAHPPGEIRGQIAQQ
jgi:Cu/Zn superoxide dismutase